MGSAQGQTVGGWRLKQPPQCRSAEARGCVFLFFDFFAGCVCGGAYNLRAGGGRKESAPRKLGQHESWARVWWSLGRAQSPQSPSLRSTASYSLCQTALFEKKKKVLFRKHKALPENMLFEENVRPEFLI